HLGEHLGEVVFRNVEHHGDGLELRNHGQAVVGVIGTYYVARVDQTQPDAPGDGSGDTAVGQLQLGVVDLRLVALDDALVLIHQGDLRVQLLFGNGVLCQ